MFAVWTLVMSLEAKANHHIVVCAMLDFIPQTELDTTNRAMLLRVIGHSAFSTGNAEKGVPKLERTSQPTFSVIVDTSRASYDTWNSIIYNVGAAVGSITENVPFAVKGRTRNTVTGAVTMANYMYAV
eukprot:1145-Heterococcus_DN1.PRE.1